MRSLIASLLPVPIVFLAALCEASVITVRTESKVELAENAVRASVHITNQGDEPAYSVQVEARLNETTVVTRVDQRVGAGESRDAAFELGEPPKPDGVYPVILKVYYSDANGYPFSALSVIPFTVGTSAPPPVVTAGMVPATITSEGTVSLVLQVVGRDNADVRTRLLLPSEIQCDDREQNLLLFPEQSKVVDFRLRNTSARPGSRYPVYAVTEYERGGQHQTLICSSLISIESPPGPLLSRRWVWLAAAGALAVVFVLAQFIGRGRGAEPPPAREA